MPAARRMFDELVETIEIEIGEELAVQVANRQPAVSNARSLSAASAGRMLFRPPWHRCVRLRAWNLDHALRLP